VTGPGTEAVSPRPPAPQGPVPRHRRPSPKPKPKPRPRFRRRPFVAIVLASSGLIAIIVGVGGWTLVSHAARDRLASQTSRIDHQPGRNGPAAQATGPVGRITGAAHRARALTVAKPSWLVIPAIGVSTTLVRLGLTAQDTLQVPSTTAVAGWYTGSPRPGQIGSSIIAGHIDSQLGPGVFYRLSELKRGQFVYVIRTDHTVGVFEVTAVRLYAKAQFPATTVYGPVPDSELRIITCGGTFDYATGSYLSNVVVYAVQVS
jgi:sortase (surface protein transpeptidase)